MLNSEKPSVWQRFIACLVLLAIAFPFFFTIVEADHSCTGDDNCAICQVISEALQFEQSGFDVAHETVVATFAYALALLVAAYGVLPLAPSTLVHLKVRIND